MIQLVRLSVHCSGTVATKVCNFYNAAESRNFVQTFLYYSFSSEIDCVNVPSG